MDPKIIEALAKLPPEDQERWLEELVMFGNAFIEDNGDGTATFKPAATVRIDATK